jgi:hypothetical protein
MQSPGKDGMQDRGFVQDALKAAHGVPAGGVPPQVLTFPELYNAVKSENWKAGYKPWPEMAKDFKKVGELKDNWSFNFKANLHYFRTNYAIVFGGAVVLTVIQRPLTLFSVLLVGLALAVELQDSFVLAVSHRLTSLAEAYAPAIAAQIHEATRRNADLRARSPAALVCGVPRALVCRVVKGMALVVLFFSGALTALISSAALGLWAATH